MFIFISMLRFKHWKCTHCQLCSSEVECHLFLPWLYRLSPANTRIEKKRQIEKEIQMTTTKKKLVEKKSIEMLNILMVSKLWNRKWWHITRCWQHKRIIRTTTSTTASSADMFILLLISPASHCYMGICIRFECVLTFWPICTSRCEQIHLSVSCAIFVSSIQFLVFFLPLHFTYDAYFYLIRYTKRNVCECEIK